MIVDSFGTKDTFELGKRMGEAAKKGEVYCLNGELGTGKTVFTKGFAAGLGVLEPVSSPTFTIVQEYTDGRLPFYHFDVYRLEEAEEMEEIGYLDYFYGEGVCLIEWADRIEELLPKKRITLRIKKELPKGLDYRKIEVILIGEKEKDRVSAKKSTEWSDL